MLLSKFKKCYDFSTFYITTVENIASVSGLHTVHAVAPFSMWKTQ